MSEAVIPVVVAENVSVLLNVPSAWMVAGFGAFTLTDTSCGG